MTEKSAELVEYSVTNIQLADLAAKYPVVPDASTTEGYQAIKECLSEVRPLRTAVEKRRKELKADALAYGRKVDARAKEITTALLDIETPFKEAKVAEDQKAEIEAQEARDAEEKRVLAIQGRVSDIHKKVEGLLNATSDQINARITEVIDINMDDFEEFGEAASFAKAAVLDSLKKAFDARVDFEQQQAEQERIAKEQREAQAALDSKQAELAAQQKKVDEERKEAARVMQEAQDKAEAEKKRVEQEKADAVRKDREKAEQEAAALKAKEEEKREAKRQEMLRPDKEILRDWVNKLRFIDAPAGLNDPLIQELARQVMVSLADLAAKTTEKMERI